MAVMGAGGGSHEARAGFGELEFPAGAVGVINGDAGFPGGIGPEEADFPEVVVAPVPRGAEGGGESTEVTAGAEAGEAEGSFTDGSVQFEVGDFTGDIAGEGVEEVGAAGIAAGIGRGAGVGIITAGFRPGGICQCDEEEGECEAGQVFHGWWGCWCRAGFRCRVNRLPGVRWGPEMEDFLAWA